MALSWVPELWRWLFSLMTIYEIHYHFLLIKKKCHLVLLSPGLLGKGTAQEGVLICLPSPWKSPVPPLSLRISILRTPPISSRWSRKIWRFPGWSHLFPPSVPSPLLRGGCRDSVFNFWDSGCYWNNNFNFKKIWRNFKKRKTKVIIIILNFDL